VDLRPYGVGAFLQHARFQDARTLPEVKRNPTLILLLGCDVPTIRRFPV
jgi:hypothetical protein